MSLPFRGDVLLDKSLSKLVKEWTTNGGRAWF